jgi:NFU1 iron-sulfur cluster scaffold homolog, mitochondrial
VPSALARAILAVPGVRGVMFSPDFVTVEKDEESQWTYLKPEIFALMMEHLVSGRDVLEGESRRGDTAVEEGDSETVQMVKELLETRIRPAIMEDGGDIEYRGFVDGEVLLKLRGACRTCDSSVVTLKNGIEAMMRHYVPEVTSVRQIMDEEEEVALKEFERLERKLKEKQGEESAAAR